MPCKLFMREAINTEEARKCFAADPEAPVKCVARKTVRKVCQSLEEAEAFFDYMSKPAPATNEIFRFFHCGLCVKEKPKELSPREWAQLEVGWTLHGLQIWCKRHECNVCHIDFEGHQHPANLEIFQRNDLGL